MQVFVAKANLINAVVPVAGSYPDTPWPWVDRNVLGSSYTPLTLPGPGVISSLDPGGFMTYQLVSDWRTSQISSIVNGEGQRRIFECFTDFMQRNANADINRSTTLYGATPSAWPADAQARKAEGDRGWTYLQQVRQTANAMTTLPNDPTDDSQWPTKITPVYINPVY
jgi:hypothetical protein